MSQSSFFPALLSFNPPLSPLEVCGWGGWEVEKGWEGEAESYGNHLKKLLFLIMKEYAWKA